MAGIACQCSGVAMQTASMSLRDQLAEVAVRGATLKVGFPSVCLLDPSLCVLTPRSIDLAHSHRLNVTEAKQLFEVIVVGHLAAANEPNRDPLAGRRLARLAEDDSRHDRRHSDRTSGSRSQEVSTRDAVRWSHRLVPPIESSPGLVPTRCELRLGRSCSVQPSPIRSVPVTASNPGHLIDPATFQQVDGTSLGTITWPDFQITDKRVELDVGMVALKGFDATGYSATFDNYLISDSLPAAVPNRADSYWRR